MRAVISDPQAPGHVRIGEVDEPEPDSHEAVVKVAAISLNRGEVRRAAMAEAGMRIGWDAAGVIEAPARDGSGPAAGARVVAFSRTMHAWAERVAIPVRDLAVLPDAVSFEDAATLPVAGLTALYCLERIDRLLGYRVLVTGASGGVGWFACQLGLLMGADVVALVRRKEHVGKIRDLGVEHVVISSDGDSLDAHGPFRAVIDGVGGPMLGALIGRLDAGGRAILYGISDGPEAPLAIRDLMLTGDGRIEGFYLFRETDAEYASKGLARLARLLADGRLKTLISVTGSWQRIGETAAALIERSYVGKAVLTL